MHIAGVIWLFQYKPDPSLPTDARMYLLACLQMRGSISPSNPWDVMVDLFFYREPEEVKDEADVDDGAPYEPPAYGGAGGLPAPQSACMAINAANIVMFL